MKKFRRNEKEEFVGKLEEIVESKKTIIGKLDETVEGTEKTKIVNYAKN